ncbi:telomeric repeat-binding factor 1 [Genypterus blacodes]|uniref:telomeric repeat-binding factor 1 n=1 Tax=Genypterus blacodes TaxID=154954 RepID=UPI003F75A881
MEDDNNKSPEEATLQHENVNFNRVSAVAERWMQDFMFVSLCRRFKEGKLEEFNAALQTFEAIQSNSTAANRTLKGEHAQKKKICSFLTRIMHGKQLDMKFEQDQQVMPLMSAAKFWLDLEDTVEDEKFFENVTVLLLVQSVALCLEKGQRSSATSALNWFENNINFPKNLRVMLSTIATRSDTYHPFLMSFTYSRLLDSVQSYLDAYLEKNPSDYILQQAVKTVQSSQSSEAPEDDEERDETLVESDGVDESEETSGKIQANTTCLKTKRKLCSTKLTDMWIPASCKKLPNLRIKVSRHDVSQLMFPRKSPEKPADTTKMIRTRQRWNWKLDGYLKSGVARHGVGQWARILLEYDFEGRTGTMLKDRWRILVKSGKVNPN